MNHDQWLEHLNTWNYAPTEKEARREIARVGSTWEELLEHCRKYSLGWNDFGVVWDFTRRDQPSELALLVQHLRG